MFNVGNSFNILHDYLFFIIINFLLINKQI